MVRSRLREESLAVLLVLLLLLIGCGTDATSSETEPDPDGTAEAEGASADRSQLGALDLTSTPTAASVFLDGRYIGETGPEGPLRVVQPAGSYQLRLSTLGHLDFAGQITLRPGLRATARVDLEPDSGHGPLRTEAVKIDVGQVVRDKIVVSREEDLAERPRPFHILTFEGRPGQERNLVLHYGQGAVDARVQAPDGTILPMRPETKVNGNPPEYRMRFAITAEGTHRIVIHAPKKTVRYVFGLEKAVPPSYDGPVPAALRRLPGQPD